MFIYFLFLNFYKVEDEIIITTQKQLQELITRAAAVYVERRDGKRMEEDDIRYLNKLSKYVIVKEFER